MRKNDELNKTYYQSKQIFESFKQCELNHLCNNTDLFMKNLDNLMDSSMFKVLIDQDEAVTLSNKPNIITNNLLGCESDETNK